MKRNLYNFLKRTYFNIGKPGEKWVRRIMGIRHLDEVSEFHTGTEYHDTVNRNKLRTLNSYSVKSSGQSSKTTLSNVNSQFFEAYGPDFSFKTAGSISVDLPWYYHNLLQKLQNLEYVRFETCAEAIKSRPKNNEIIITVRHDVDGDLSAALQQAEIENSLNIRTSYYLLHNAPYYGVVETTNNNGKTVFNRNESSSEIYQNIQNLGHEIALHTDGMDYYQRLKTDGAEVIKTELAWLRSNKLTLTGTTAHNSFSVYGCNNYSIFKDRPLAVSTDGGPRAVTHNGKWAPLQTLCEQELGLDYEANDFFWQTHTPLFYACLMTQNNWYMACNQYGMLDHENKNSRAPLRAWHGTHDDLYDAISKLKGPHYVKLVVHPMHYGLRESHLNLPWFSKNASDTNNKKVNLWSGGGTTNEIAGAAITYMNEFNTPDRGLSCYKSSNFQIAFFGEDNLATKTIGVDSRMSQVSARLARGPLKKPFAIATASASVPLNYKKSKIDLSKLEKHDAPDFVVISIDREASSKHIDFLTWVDELLTKNYPVIILFNVKINNSNAFDNLAKKHLGRLTILQAMDVLKLYDGSAKLTWHNSDIWTPQSHFLIGKKLSEIICTQLAR